ncbi:hypothetical protein B0J14DRAFT_571426 [Halenospora varia]|nr:hypothetical protein B0J14DRAFT_571426 [Halenospora varia]
MTAAFDNHSLQPMLDSSAPSLFVMIPQQMGAGAEPEDDATLGRAEDKIMLRKLATEFANKLPEQEFSPAEIQSFLLEYRRSPHMAVENVQEWVVRAREAKRRTKRADSGVIQEGGDLLD